MTLEARCWHQGANTLSSDASDSFKNKKSGWVVRVGGILLGSPSTEVTRKELADGTLSNNPLVLLTAARLVLEIM